MYRDIIRLHEARGDMIAADEITVTDAMGRNMLLVREGTPIGAKVMAALYRHKIETIAILTENPIIRGDQPQYKEPPKPVKIPQSNVAAVIEPAFKKECINNIRDLFTYINTPQDDGGGDSNMTTAYQAIKGLDDVLNRLIVTVTQDAGEMIHLHDLKHYDEYTYHHSLSVAVLSIATGQSMGMDLFEIKRLARSAALHDIGKITIPQEIINKPGRLTPEEFDIVKQHSINGLHTLKCKGIGDAEMLNAILLHHEKCDGSGYPNGLTKDEIPLFSRIISVADVYDAVTSYRSYRFPKTPSEAYDLIMSEVNRSFDYDVVKAFIKKLILYPIGSVLELSDSRIGEVIDNTNELRPALKMQDNGQTVDLSKNQNLIIKHVHYSK
ncbi:MAG: HD-GYP domain-containing protein [Defluviitaleaceae bacterium]|nr:HD-GYP domain-containing protein [Defluviitaleaceae bacterium]MCL2263999.1 HD-GYP domain-containing protein [Defluviitaleaceae bacterium]